VAELVDLVSQQVLGDPLQDLPAQGELGQDELLERVLSVPVDIALPGGTDRNRLDDGLLRPRELVDQRGHRLRFLLEIRWPTHIPMRRMKASQSASRTSTPTMSASLIACSASISGSSGGRSA
jgi:hypothetical protein